MSDLFEDDPAPAAPAPGGNLPELSVSEVSGAVRRVIEAGFGHVRVRGEIGRVVLARTGHLYFDLKDDRAVLAAITWKGQVGRLRVQPEEGMEVIATGRLTTFPGQSKYQMIVDDIAPAGVGALMALLDRRRRALEAEGLFAPDRKRPLPFLPEVIGVVTSPTGAVIRDILHRLRDRFPRRVVIWPVAVQGTACAAEVAAAIRGFNALMPGGAVPRPDLIIVARGGGSIEDLWGFNEEVVVRAAAAGTIPLISAVGHETDTTLLDHVADRRAPTPSAAAEMAVPVRLDMLAWADQQGARLSRAVAQVSRQRGQRLRDLARALPRPEGLVAQAQQRFDLWATRLPAALRAATGAKRRRFHALPPLPRPGSLAARARQRLDLARAALPAALRGATARQRQQFASVAALVRPDLPRRAVLIERRALERLGARLRRETLLAGVVARQAALHRLADRLLAATAAQIALRRSALEAQERLRQTLGYVETLRRGYAVVRNGGHVVTTVATAAAAAVLEIEFQDGRMSLPPRARRKPSASPTDQGTLI